MNGEIVNTLHQIAQLAADKRSLCTDGGMLDRPKPAAVVINMSGQVILQLIHQGLYVYEPKSKQEI